MNETNRCNAIGSGGGGWPQSLGLQLGTQSVYRNPEQIAREERAARQFYDFITNSESK